MLNVIGVLVQQSDKIKLLGVMLDNKLTLTGHVNVVCKTTFFHIRALQHIRNLLTEDTAKTIACALVGSSLDYANLILYEVSGANIHKLQRMQNTIAQVVKLSRSNTGVTGILKHLHWLPVRCRINFKITTLVYLGEVFVAAGLTFVTHLRLCPIRSLRSTGTHILHTAAVLRRRGFACLLVVGTKSLEQSTS